MVEGVQQGPVLVGTFFSVPPRCAGARPPLPCACAGLPGVRARGTRPPPYKLILIRYFTQWFYPV